MVPLFTHVVEEGQYIVSTLPNMTEVIRQVDSVTFVLATSGVGKLWEYEIDAPGTNRYDLVRNILQGIEDAILVEYLVRDMEW